MDVSSDEELWSKPMEVFIKTEGESENVLPEKSKKKYNNAYEVFREWQKLQECSSITEDVLLQYFKNLATKSKPPTLWAQFSMLKSTINIHNNIDIGAYKNLIGFIKNQSVGYTRETTKLFTSSEIEKFLFEAPDDKYLATKVACIFGVTGACRRAELVNLTVGDIETHGKLILVKIQDSAINKSRSFVVPEDFYDIVKRYQDLRPPNVPTERFFLSLQNGKCTQQVIGVNKFGCFPKQIAEFLNLPDPHLYTGHCFRQTSVKLLASSGAHTKKIKYHYGRWKSAPVVEGSEEECVEFMNVEKEIGKLITESISVPSSPSTSNFVTEIPLSKRKRIEDEVQSKMKTTSVNLQIRSSAKEEPSTEFQWSSLENIHLHFNNCTNHITINVYKQ